MLERFRTSRAMMDDTDDRVIRDPVKAARRAMLIATGQLPNPREPVEQVAVTVEPDRQHEADENR